MFKQKALQLAVVAGLATMSGSLLANGADMVNPEGAVIVGYWHNWANGGGYKGGIAPAIRLSQIHQDYNVIDVSFMKVFDIAEGRIPTFKLDPATGMTEDQFIQEISDLNAQGRSVLIALGGADAHIELVTGDEQAFAAELIRLTDKYGFDGLDIDLEQSAVTAANNQTVIPAALRMVKDHYRLQGKNFLITMAAEFPYLTTGGKYLPYITGLEGYYDWINPQFYNQGGDGVYVEGPGLGWIAQNNDAKKEEFIYYISDSIINGTRGFSQIPHDKLVFGIPSSNDAAATGYVKNPQDLYNAFNRLAAQGQPLRGVMTWSINWDMGTDSSGKPYNSQFIKDYGTFIHGMDVGTTTPPAASNKPVISGATNVRIGFGASFDAMAGITASDVQDGDLTSAVRVDGWVNTAALGSYSLTYTVTDSDDNTTTVKRVVEVFSELPVFAGVSRIVVQLGEEFDALAGVTARDPEDGDVTSRIEVISNTVNVHAAGTYSVSYSVTDSAGQTVTAQRQVVVVDGAACTNNWNASDVYNGGDVVSHNGSDWQAGWWTKGDEPGTTGEWGVWKQLGDSNCSGSVKPPVVELDMSVTGLNSQYAAVDGRVDINITVEANEYVTVEASIVDSKGRVVAEESLSQVTVAYIAMALDNAEAGAHTLTVKATAENGAEKTFNQAFTVLVDSGEGEVIPPTGDYPSFEAGSYNAGDIIMGSDGNLYQCKPWPYTGWCGLTPYAPVSGPHWPSAWDAL